MKRLVCIVGKSGSGKDTIVEAIIKNSNYIVMTPCTTRPMREGEEERRPYHFITDEQVDKEMIAKTIFHSVEGDWYYGFTKEVLDKDKNYIAVVNPAQVKDICDMYQKDFRIIIVSIETDEETRIIHAINREEKNKRNFEELCRRIKTDAFDFSDKNDVYVDAFERCDKSFIAYNDYEMTPDEIAFEILRKIEVED